MQSQSFDTLPGFSSLFKDFCRRREPVMMRFPSNALLEADTEHWRRIAAQNTHRSLITSAIHATLPEEELTPLQRENLRALDRSTTLTVITGQQTGLFGGALYTMLKAWTTIQTAQNLTSKHSGLQFIPVFWVEDNDHDIAEISSVALWDKQGEALELSIDWNANGAQSPTERTSVAELRFNAGIATLVEQVKEALPQTEFSTEILAVLDAYYADGKTLTGAFTRLMQYALGATGILFASAAELRKQGAFLDVVRGEIEQAANSEAALKAASDELSAAGYHLQAQTLPLNLFYHEGGKRHKISRMSNAQSDHQFQAGERFFSQAALLQEAHAHPELFSPNVLLRPVAQDTAFPNAAYVAGPGEVGYLAQTKELYKVMGVSPAAVVARHSATFVDGRTEQILETTAFVDLLQPYELVEKQAMERLENKELAAEFDATRASIEAAFTTLHPHIATLDPTLVPTADKTKTQALQGVETLASKVRRAQKQKQEVALNKLRKAHTLVFPFNGLQERAFTVLSLLAKYGVQEMNGKFQSIVAQEADKHYIVRL
jgi:bacillithiol biosynthesis cysteine-adding enzyme BshC